METDEGIERQTEGGSGVMENVSRGVGRSSDSQIQTTGDEDITDSFNVIAISSIEKEIDKILRFASLFCHPWNLSCESILCKLHSSCRAILSLILHVKD